MRGSGELLATCKGSHNRTFVLTRPHRRHGSRYGAVATVRSDQFIANTHLFGRNGAPCCRNLRSRNKALIPIAHHAHVVMLRAEHEHHFVLHVIGVLIFVDKDVTEPALVGLENVGMFAEQLHGVRKQVVEVHSAGFEKAGLVVDENLGDLAIEDGAGSCSETGGVETFVLGRGNRTVHRARRELLGIEAEVANAIAREAFGIGLVVDRE
ncbi:unannotated protein [freshwater metagenome]|uniref:Unannotated protein n=1 Tax=freshwater metagenome TaxID=449393 RepID=A0A6J6I9U4_9ZZZZ